MIAHYKRAQNKSIEYMRSHPNYWGMLHMIGGVGIGLIISRPLVANPVRWGVALVALSIIGYLWPLVYDN